MNEAQRKEIEAELLRMLEPFEELATSQAHGLKALEAIQHGRAERLAELRARLAEHLDEDDPRLVKATRDFARAKQLERATVTEQLRIGERPAIDKEGWTVAGRFYDESGEPLAGVMVRLATKKGRQSIKFEEVKANQFGEFAFNLSEEALKKQFGDKQPKFIVEAIDPKSKKKLFASTSAMDFRPRHVDVFDQPLNRPASLKARPKKPAKPKTRKGKAPPSKSPPTKSPGGREKK